MTRITKFRLFVACAALLLSAAALNAIAAEETPTPAPLPAVAKGCVRATLEVNYCCEGCAGKVVDAVKALKGVTFVNASLPDHKLTVDRKEKVVSLRKIKDAILALGYSVDGEEPKEEEGQ